MTFPTAYELALKFTLDPSTEGGYSDNKNDHGGATNYGVTQAVYTRYKGKEVPVSECTEDEAKEIYFLYYWKPAKCPQLPEKLAICHFDWAVNHGVNGAAETLQKALGVNVDGDIGPKTLAAVAATDEGGIIVRYIWFRQNWYIKDATDDPSQNEFLNGWIQRTKNLKSYLDSLSV